MTRSSLYVLNDATMWLHRQNLTTCKSLKCFLFRNDISYAGTVHPLGKFLKDSIALADGPSLSLSPLYQSAKNGKFLLFKMAGHNLSMEHKCVRSFCLRWTEPRMLAFIKKVFKPTSRFSFQGSMRLKNKGLGKRNGLHAKV